MFGKLLKWEFKLHRKILFLYIIVALSIFSLYVFTRFDLTILTAISTIMTILSIPTVAVGTGIILMINYYKTLYGKECYVNHMIPVKSSKIYYVKLLVSTLYTIFTIIVIAIAILFIVSIFERIPVGDLLGDIGYFISNLNYSIDNFTVYYSAVFWVIMIIIALFSIIFSQLNYMGIITLAMNKRFQKFGVPGIIVGFIVVGIIIQILSFILISIIPYVLELHLDPNTDLYRLRLANVHFADYNSTYPAGAIGKPVRMMFMPIGVLITPLISVFWFFFTRNQLNKHKNII